MSTNITPKEVMAALNEVMFPGSQKSLAEMNMIREVKVVENNISLTVALAPPAGPQAGTVEKNVREAIQMALPHAGEININVNVTPGPQQGKKPDLLPGVKNIVVVASGKGGVGKSTVTVNLAIAMAATGAKVGLLDADIYGPSIPVMVGQHVKPGMDENKKIVPVDAFGLKVMSIGFLVDPDKAVIWRGPLISSAVTQLSGDVAWGELDYLFMDLPPGTGDVQLTIAQKIHPTGAILVTTPQSVAVSEVTRTQSMFEKVNIPVLGIIENMSYFVCPECKAEHRIFGEGGAKRFSEEHQVPILAEIPLDSDLRTSGDDGKPAAFGGEGEIAEIFKKASLELADVLKKKNEAN